MSDHSDFCVVGLSTKMYQPEHTHMSQVDIHQQPSDELHKHKCFDLVETGCFAHVHSILSFPMMSKQNHAPCFAM